MNESIPQHVAIVMDGNGRWAENRGLERFEGHRAGAESVRTIIRSCLTYNIPVLSLFAFSSENWSRPIQEVDFLMQLFLESLSQEIAELHKQGVALRFTGFREELSLKLRDQMQQAEQLTAHNKRLVLNIVINYGGRWDISHATKAIAAQVLAGKLTLDEIDDSIITKHLSTQGLPDPDLFIRTSGEQRVSNFFLWQLAYTELYFAAVHWPDFTKEEFEKALNSFKQRERRYGKISQQLNEIEHV